MVRLPRWSRPPTGTRVGPSEASELPPKARCGGRREPATAPSGRWQEQARDRRIAPPGVETLRGVLIIRNQGWSLTPRTLPTPGVVITLVGRRRSLRNRQVIVHRSVRGRVLEYVDVDYRRRHLGIAAGSLEQLRCSTRRFSRFLGHDALLDDLTTDKLLDFLQAILQEGVSPNTCNSKRKDLLAIARDAERHVGLAPVGPVGRVKTPRRLPEAWTTTEVERLVSTARTLPNWVGHVPERVWWPALLLAIYSTSARIRAMLSLRTKDLNLSERFLILRAEAQKTSTDQCFWLTDQAVAALAGLVATGPNGALVFDWRYSSKWLWKRMGQIVDKAGLPRSERGMGLFHKLRRTTLSYVGAQNPEAAQQMAGHASLTMTRNSYFDPRVMRADSSAALVPRLNLTLEGQRQLRLF